MLERTEVKHVHHCACARCWLAGLAAVFFLPHRSLSRQEHDVSCILRLVLVLVCAIAGGGGGGASWWWWWLGGRRRLASSLAVRGFFLDLSFLLLLW
jgi:fatty acid desaturase